MAARRRQKGGEVFKQEDILQAVVIADSFNVRFAPITNEKPRALLPLANLPLLEYTLDFLCTAEIQDVIVFCGIHSAQIKKYLASRKWTSESCSMEVTVIVSEDCLSVGDALRDIDAKSLINNDFVLVNGDMVSNVKLKPIIEAHKARRLQAKTPIMTMVHKRAPPGHATRCQEDDAVLAIRPDNQQVLSFQMVGTHKAFHIPLEVFEENKNFQLRYDLLDTHISICSPHVPSLFTDNFDYSTRDDFVRGILVNEEILGNTIHVHILEDEYAARVSNLHMYDAVSKDVLNRWSYPMVPDSNITSLPDDQYSLRRHNVYLHKDVTLARGCILQHNVQIGQGSSVGSNAFITDSVIGKNCKIGHNVRIEGAYLWDDVTVDDDSRLKKCILDDGVHVKKKVTVEPGCVLATEVVVGPDVTLLPATYLMASPGDEDEDEEPEVLGPEVVGAEGRAYLYRPPTQDEDDEEEGLEELVQPLWGLQLEGEDEEWEDDESSIGDMDSDGVPHSESPLADESKMFFDEVMSSLERALAENISKDNMVLEVNSVKSAYGIYIKEVNQVVTRAVLELPLHAQCVEPAEYLKQLKKNFGKFLPLLQNYIRSDESQMDCLTSIEETCLTNPVIQKTVQQCLHFLYEADLLSEETILKWHATPTAGDDATKRQELRKQLKPFIQWLEEADEESDEESEED